MWISGFMAGVFITILVQYWAGFLNKKLRPQRRLSPAAMMGTECARCGKPFHFKSKLGADMLRLDHTCGTRLLDWVE